MTNHIRQLQRPTQTAFTLVELLVVIAIIAALAVIVLPTVTWGGQKAETLRTESVLQITDKGLQSFEKLHRGIAFPAWLETDPTDQPVNKLFWRLNHDLTDSEMTANKAATLLAKNDAAAVILTDADVYQGAHTATTWPTWQDDYFDAMKKEFGILARVNTYNELMSDVIIDRTDIGNDFIATYTDGNGNSYESIVDAWGQPLIYAGKYDIGIPYKVYDSWAKKALPFGVL